MDDPNILVIGSQSVLATFDEDELPDAATASMEVDLAYFDDPTEDKADAVDGAIGELAFPRGTSRGPPGIAPGSPPRSKPFLMSTFKPRG